VFEASAVLLNADKVKEKFWFNRKFGEENLPARFRRPHYA